MTEYLQLIGLTLIGGVISLIGGVLLLSKKSVADKLAYYATPFAAGALLAAVFLDLLKDGLEHGSSDTILLATLIGMLLFFFAERFLRWFHHHHEDEDAATVPLIVVGDTMHNFLDGVAIAAAFLISPATGLVTTIAVAAHEIPQEIGDFGLLLKKGVRRKKVLFFNLLSALATTVGAVITYTIGDRTALPTDFLLGLSAGFLLYIAASDIIPSIHEHTSQDKKRAKLLDWQPLLLLLGVVIVGLSVNIAHRYIDTEHHDHASDVHMTEEYHPEEEHHADECDEPQVPGQGISYSEAKCRGVLE